MANGNHEKEKRRLKKPKRERTPGEVIVAARKEYNWSREYLEMKSGVSVSQIGRIERGVADPGLETITKLEEALGIELLDLFMEYRKSGESKKKKAEVARNVLQNFEKERAGKEKGADGAACDPAPCCSAPEKPGAGEGQK